MYKQTYALASFAAAFTLAFAPNVLAQTSVAIGMAAGVNQVPSLVASDQGFFKEEGIDIDLKPVPRGQVAIEAVASGSIQFAESSHTSFIAAVNKGIPLVGVGVAARGYYGKFIASNENADLKTLQDLKGKRIGTQVGTGMHMVLLMLLEKEGLTEADFQITNVRVNDMPAAMAAGGNFDAVLGWEPGMQRIVQGGYGKEIITARQIEEMAAITYPFILATTEEF
jgi:NitT/TauT family transport system substrate-binding protein